MCSLSSKRFETTSKNDMGGSGKIESSSGGWGGEERGDGVGGERAPFACFFFQSFYFRRFVLKISESSWKIEPLQQLLVYDALSY